MTRHFFRTMEGFRLGCVGTRARSRQSRSLDQVEAGEADESRAAVGLYGDDLELQQRRWEGRLKQVVGKRSVPLTCRAIQLRKGNARRRWYWLVRGMYSSISRCVALSSCITPLRETWRGESTEVRRSLLRSLDLVVAPRRVARETRL